jgi:hypothetical protein
MQEKLLSLAGVTPVTVVTSWKLPKGVASPR